MKNDSYVMASAVVFAVVGLLHLLRLIAGWPVILGTMSVPLGVSVLVILVCAVLALWGFRTLRHPA
jgi:predicted tellurium resistance membrane protein TerC